MADIQTLVARGAEIFDEIERDLFKHEKLADELDAILRQSHSLGHVGYLKSNVFAARAKEITVTSRRQMFELHQDVTDKAIEENVDLPQPRSGGGGR